MPTVDLPVFLFDVTSTDVPPRIVVSCRTPAAAQELATRLEEMRRNGLLAGDESFTAAVPRRATGTLAVIPGDQIIVQGYAVDAETLAAAINDAKAAGTPIASTAPLT